MRIKLLLISILVYNVALSQTIIKTKNYGILEFKEFDYGLASVVSETKAKLDKSPTGNRNWIEGFEIVKVTDSIPLFPKTHFGSIYVINSKNTMELETEIEWIFPQKIINDKGKSFKTLKYKTVKTTNKFTSSSYGLDEPYELVKGKWILNIFIENKIIYTKTFILF